VRLADIEPVRYFLIMAKHSMSNDKLAAKQAAKLLNEGNVDAARRVVETMSLSARRDIVIRIQKALAKRGK
jgi:hypothetical protein